MTINRKQIVGVLVVCMVLTLSGCSSVFKAGVSGKVVDAESTNKTGISNVQVYAYTSEAERNGDYDRYQSLVAGNPDYRFSPTGSSYMGKTTTNANGAFTVNKLVWESFAPQWGKTADSKQLFLLFYHEDYGLVKNTNQVVVVSDSTNADSVYQEMTSIKASTTIALNIRNVASGDALAVPVNVTMMVLQDNNGIDGTYKAIDPTPTITGNGNITVTYPRDVANPTVKITLEQSSNTKTWKQAYNNDATKGYEFYGARDKLEVSFSGTQTTIDAYMKTTELSYPSISGRLWLGKTPTQPLGDTSDDDVTIWLGYNENGNLTLFPYAQNQSARVETKVSGDGANGATVTHGLFNGLGSGMTWTDEDYADQYLSKKIYVVVDANRNKGLDVNDYYCPLTINSNAGSESVGILSHIGYPTPSDSFNLKPVSVFPQTEVLDEIQ